MKVKLHSNDESAANATDATLKMIPMGGNAHLERGSDGNVSYDADGFATVVTSNPGFVAFALRNQGYVREVVE